MDFAYAIAIAIAIVVASLLAPRMTDRSMRPS
jgi:hypothetical protein